MGAPLEFCSKRGVVAVLASGVVISLTALTGGIAPAFAKPDDQSGSTTTVVVPEPEPEQAAEPEAKSPEPKRGAPQQAPAVPAAPAIPAVPAAPAEPVVPAEPAVPATSASPPSVQAPKTQVTQGPAASEPEPEAPASKPPSTAVAPPVTAVETDEPSEAEETTAARKPATVSEPSSATESAPTSASQTAPRSSAAPTSASQTAQSSASSSKPSAALVPGSEAGQAPASESTEASTSKSASRESETAKPDEDNSSSQTPTVSVTQAAKEIETIEPQTLAAAKEDIQLAKSAKPIFEPNPAPAAEKDVAEFSNSIETSLKIPGLEIGASSKTELGVERRDVELVSQVRQWRPDWIEYDEFYRPILLNPFRAPVRIVYVYDFAPRIVIIPPLARMVIEAAQFAAYSFTAAVLAPINAAIDTAQALTSIAVGSFFGGGVVPGIGVPFVPPPPVLRYDNVPVFVNYSRAQYEPFRVRQIVDVGDDPQFGERKVLLDGATPAWGVWTQSPTGERQFEIHRTQQFPGLDAPAEAPLPGDYRLRLLSDEAPDSGFTGRDIFLFVTAGVIGTLGFGALAMAFYLGRRRPQE